MKKIFAKFKISRALDAGQPVPAPLRRQASENDKLGDFLERAETVDRMLKREKTDAQVPATLHNSIMRAVRQAQPEPERRPIAVGWLPATALAAVLVLAAVWGWHWKQASQSAKAETLAAATEAFQMSKEFAQTIPAKVIEPVSGELEKVNQDAESTARFVLASIPLSSP